MTAAAARLRLRTIAVSLVRPKTVSAVVLFAVAAFQSSQPFVFDAALYWNGAQATVRGAGSYVQGGLSFRGVLTSWVYVPAAAVAELRPSLAGFAVLIENSLLIAVVGAILVPAAARMWIEPTPGVTYVGAAISGLVLIRFAPFPLMDIWAAGLCLAAVVALRERSLVGVALAGAALGAAFNLRPAYLLVLASVLVVVLLGRRWHAVVFAACAGLAVLPQVIVDRVHGAGWSVWPPQTEAITQLQSSYASYVIRYDTVWPFAGSNPQQFFCDPAMARATAHESVTSPGHLLGVYARHLPDAAWLVLEKLGAVLQWRATVPYYSRAPGGEPLFAVFATAVATVGICALMRWVRPWSVGKVAAIVTCAATAVTIVGSTPEARFALPLMLFGSAGWAVLWVRRPSWRVLLSGFAVVALLFAFGRSGLSHTAPPGRVTQQVCAAT